MSSDSITLVKPGAKYCDSHIAVKWPTWANREWKEAVARETPLDPTTDYKLVPLRGYAEFIAYLDRQGYDYHVRGDLRARVGA
jgi:hypothetical protein